MGALVGTESVSISTASGSVVSGSAALSRAVGLLAQAIPARVNTPNAGAVGSTLTAASLVGGIITRSGTSAAFTDTTDTAAAIIAALPAEAPINTAWDVFIRNTTPFTQTIAGGTGVTISGGSVIPGNSTGIFKVIYTGAASISLVSELISPTDLGVIVANTAVSTVGAATLAAAAIVGGLITRTGSTSNFTDTTDTAANIIAALPNPSLGQSWELIINNQTAVAETLAGGSGVTLSGLSGPVPANSTARALVTYSGAGQVTIQIEQINYNAAGGSDPATVTTLWGGSTGVMFEEGPFYREIDAASPINPGSTGNDNVLSIITIPASAFNAAFKGIHATFKGNFGANGNTKRLKIFANPTSPVVGSAVSGGTLICDSGALTTNAGGWQLEAEVFKYGAAGSNTQLATAGGVMAGSTHGGTGGAPVLLTMTESGSVTLVLTGNATTSASDIALYQAMATAFN